jgi:hypothetical protein
VPTPGIHFFLCKEFLKDVKGMPPIDKYLSKHKSMFTGSREDEGKPPWIGIIAPLLLLRDKG